MAVLLRRWSHMPKLDRHEATQPICDGSLFNDAYTAGCVIDLSQKDSFNQNICNLVSDHSSLQYARNNEWFFNAEGG